MSTVQLSVEHAQSGMIQTPGRINDLSYFVDAEYAEHVERRDTMKAPSPNRCRFRQPLARLSGNQQLGALYARKLGAVDDPMRACAA